ncbi:Por secretion system C-terminal sorting domain-containing protein [Pustulibacterium marinum]|uniref:Por secretion system C-terminal sorting domain-containing protein n=1 Tax=Pustulibacterium marinum TaxID=1224947 RepID=A0A1I7F678_9FLAO|nr:S8 family serine peptidase [Pustulibacterium marinum]SFU31646.1 Por secretion system C-terminal sorting domain-containing protein [Pustulibacterium marinum]
MKRTILTFALLSIGLISAQTKDEQKQITKNYNISKLSTLEKQFNQVNKSISKKINSFLESHPSFQLEYTQNGIGYRLVNIIEDKPIYICTDNYSSARATQTDALQVNGSLNLDLTGENMNIGIWDQGYALATHNEFTNNGTQTSRVTFPDTGSANPTSAFHATHVTGTIGAQGITQSARGMATHANLYSYNWTNDILEVTNEASSGLLISNHSYGAPIYSNGEMNVPTWYMGCYNTAAQQWDQLAYNTPYYLMVVSAGNDGSESYEGQLFAPFDKLNGNKNSKNNLVIANANATVHPLFGLQSFVINSSSSQGPSDDGRIKPDIAGEGTQVYSTSNESNSSYDPSTGTSMASPNVAGSLLLLQEYYNNTYSSYMKSSTLKALVCHTANDDEQKAGPDPMFGWGLLDTKTAAETITESSINEAMISENTLNEGESFTITVTTDDPSSLKATICWTDPAGEDQSGELNSSVPALVNDLDLRISDENNTFYPWKLDATNPSALATTGDNLVDNVEKVENIESTSTTFEITVSHKDTLANDAQDYALIITGSNLTMNTDNSLSFKNINVYPNPASDFVTVSLNETFDDVQFELYDIYGKRVFTSGIQNSIQEYHIPLTSLSRGMYLVKVSTNSYNYTTKIVKK